MTRRDALILGPLLALAIRGIAGDDGIRLAPIVAAFVLEAAFLLIRSRFQGSHRFRLFGNLAEKIETGWVYLGTMIAATSTLLLVAGTLLDGWEAAPKYSAAGVVFGCFYGLLALLFTKPAKTAPASGLSVLGEP